MKVDFANLSKQTQRYQQELSNAMQEVVDNSAFIMGAQVQQLEQALVQYCGVNHAIACGSGTDALLLSLMALDIQPGDEVITTPFTFFATAEVIAFLKAKPVFVDIVPQTYNIDVSKIEQAITDKTKVIMPVSLYGQPANMTEINQLAEKHQLTVIEDAAQSFGAMYQDRMSCNLSSIACTSFFPAKPLGCFGDGGAAFTSDEALAKKIQSLRVHGQTARYQHSYIGMGGRLDTLQAAVLLVKLKHYPQDLLRRQEVAKLYSELLTDVSDKITLPFVETDRTSAWAQYSIRVNNREEVQATLREKGIPTAVHYPIPLHFQECFKYLGYQPGAFPVSEAVCKEIMSLPMNPDLTIEEISYVAEQLKLAISQA